MKSGTSGFVFLLVLSTAVPLAAQSIPNATATATVAARSEDVGSVDAIIGALYDANTELVDRKQGADRSRSLFVPGARLMPTFRPPGGKGVIGIQTVDDYVQRASSGPPRHGFFEREIARTSEAYGNIMQVFSTYESRRDSTDTRRGHGINSIQLFNDGTRWWVVGVLWDNERPDKPIPAVYMKSRTPAR